MLKQILCNHCQAPFPRRRALQRHLALSKCPAAHRSQPAPASIELSPLPGLAGPPSPDVEAPAPPAESPPPVAVKTPAVESRPLAQPTLAEVDVELLPCPPSISPVCSLRDPPTPAYRGSGPTPPERIDEPAPRPGRRSNFSSTPFSTRGATVRIYPRRRLHDQPLPHRVSVHLLRPKDGKHQERDTTDIIDDDVCRRLCDCVKCVGDACQIASSVLDRVAHVPRAAGVRFLLLPGIRTAPAAHVDKQRLAHLLERRPEMTWVVCGCATCVAHRNLARAWLRALAVSTSTEHRPQEARRCRQPRRRHHSPQRRQRSPHRPEDVANRRRH